MARLEAHAQRLQESLDEANTLSERMSARSVKLAADRARDRAIAEQETARLSREATEAHRSWIEAQAARAEEAGARAHTEMLRCEAESQIYLLQGRIETLRADRDARADQLALIKADLVERSSEASEASNALAQAEAEKIDLASRRDALQKDHAELVARLGQMTRDSDEQSRLWDAERGSADEEKSDLWNRIAALQEHHGRAISEYGQIKADLLGRLERQAKCLQLADARIDALVDDRPRWWERLGQSLGLHRRSKAYDELAGWNMERDRLLGSADAPDGDNLSQDHMNLLSENRGRDPNHRADSLRELLSWDDIDFIRCAYVTVLGRQPDSAGEAHFAQQIRAGYSKLDVLLRLRRSSEGKSHDPGIAGFDRALKRAAWQRRPILGALARLLRPDADGQSRNDKALRSVMNATAINQKYLSSINQRLIAIELQAPRPLERLSAASDREPEQVPVAAEPDAATPVVVAPELDHLRSRSPMARYFRDNAW